MQFKNAVIYTDRFSFRRGAFSVVNGRFQDVLGEPAEDAVDLHGAYVIPGLIDVHTHGSMGADLSDGDEAGIARMASYEASCGVTSFAPATMTLPYETLSRAFLAAKRVADRHERGQAAIRGVHMEGPFFSLKKKGAQNADYLRNPDFAAFEKLYNDCGGLVRIVDVAPELPGAAKFIAKASRLCTVSLAHTDADYEAARRGIDAGATHLTHLYNAMPGIHHRNPGVIPAGAECERVSAELISDGQHVHPASVRLAFRIFGAERIVLISDSLRCCGMPDGDYELGGQIAHLSGGIARLADGTIAGSATCLYDCMLRAVSFGIPREDAIRAATWNPARQIGALGEVGSITNGKSADFVICDADLMRREVYIAGERI